MTTFDKLIVIYGKLNEMYFRGEITKEEFALLSEPIKQYVYE